MHSFRLDWLVASCLATTLTAGIGVAEAKDTRPSKLVITEVLYQNQDPEWSYIELYNGTDHAVDLGGYVIANYEYNADRLQKGGLSGSLGPGKFAIVYNLRRLKTQERSCADDQQHCVSLFQAMWPTSKDALMVPYAGLAGDGTPEEFPMAGNGLSLWASMTDYNADADKLSELNPGDMPKNAVMSVVTNAATEQAWTAYPKHPADDATAPTPAAGTKSDPRARRTVAPRDPWQPLAPTLYLANLAGDPSDPNNWKFSVIGVNGAYKAHLEAITDEILAGNRNELSESVIGNPGQF